MLLQNIINEITETT